MLYGAFLNLHFNHLVYFNIILIYVQVLNLHLMLKSLKQILDRLRVFIFHQFSGFSLTRFLPR